MSKAAELAKMGEVLTNGQIGGRRNIFINGAMQVSQRATSFTFAHDGTTNAYTLDRWQWQMHNTDELDGTITQDSDAPSGFKNSYKWATGTAESAIATDEFVAFRQNVEAQDLQQLKYGTADAKTLTISFYVKSSVTGTYGLSLYKPDQTARSNNKTYTIDSANTWEFKTVTFPADTGGGGIDDDTGNGMSVYWVLATGATYGGTNSSGAWINNSTASFFGGHAQDGVITTASATWLITGVQMEVGSTSTPFEHRSFGEELQLCQRYYYERMGAGTALAVSGGQFQWVMSGLAYNTTLGIGGLSFPTPMRTTPTLGYSNVGHFVKQTAGRGDYVTGLNLYDGVENATTTTAYIQFNTSTSTAGGAQMTTESSSARLNFDAEL